MKKMRICEIIYFICAFLWVIVAIINTGSGNKFMTGFSFTLCVIYFALGIVYHRRVENLRKEEAAQEPTKGEMKGREQ